MALVENEDGLRVHRISEIYSPNAECITRGDTGWQFDPAANQIFGKVVAYSRDGRQQPLNAWQLQVVHPLASVARRIFLATKRRFENFLRLQAAVLLLFVVVGFSATAAYGQSADLALTQTVVPQRSPLATTSLIPRK